MLAAIDTVTTAQTSMEVTRSRTIMVSLMAGTPEDGPAKGTMDTIKMTMAEDPGATMVTTAGTIEVEETGGTIIATTVATVQARELQPETRLGSEVFSVVYS